MEEELLTIETKLLKITETNLKQNFALFATVGLLKIVKPSHLQLATPNFIVIKPHIVLQHKLY